MFQFMYVPFDGSAANADAIKDEEERKKVLEQARKLKIENASKSSQYVERLLLLLQEAVDRKTI